MSDSILVPMDGSEMAERALEYAFTSYEADVTVLHVKYLELEKGSLAGLRVEDPERIREAARDKAENVFDRAREIASDHDAEIETVFETGRIARTIVGYVEENDFDEIVIGSHGREGTSRVLLGSVAETVARRSPVPTTLVK